MKKSVLLMLLMFSLKTFAQKTTGLIGSNFWYTSLDAVWGKVETMEPELIRIGGIGPNEGYLGTAFYSGALTKIASAGAEPLVQISDQWTDAQVRELLASFVSANRAIKYFAIGNEPDHRGVSVANVIIYYKRLAPIIRTYYPSCILVGPAFANFSEGYIAGDYTTFLNAVKDTKDANGKYILNVFDFHIYNSAFNSSGQVIYDLATVKTRMNLLLPKIVAINATRPSGEQLNWAVTEFNINYSNDAIDIGGTKYTVPTSHKTYNFYAGQYFAQMFGYCMEQKGLGVTTWSIFEQSGSRSAIDLGLFDAAPTYNPRSSYYHSQMLTQNMKTATIAYADNKSDVQVVSMKDNTGTTVMVMNTQSNAYALSLELDMTSTAPATLAITVDAGFNKYITDNIAATSTKVYLFDNTGTLTKTITYSKADAEASRAPTVTVPSTVAVTSVSLSSTTLSINTPATSQLTATVSPTNATNKTVTWTTSNGAVATVSATGLVSSVAAGSATITATTQDGAKVATCAVTITSTVAVTGVSLSSTTLSINKPATSQLTATVSPTNATNKTVTWTSSNATVATVNATGLVTSVNAGNATITATTQDGAKVANCAVTVTVAAAFSLKIEAESYSAMFGVQTQTTTDAGGGLNVGYLDPNDWMAYNNITIPTTGTYTIAYRIASLAGGGSLQLETNAGATILDPAFAIPSTGGWQNWQTVTRTVTLPAGTYNLGLKVVTGGFNINWLTITKTSGARISANAEGLSGEQTQGPNIVIYPNPTTENFTVVKEEEGTSVLNISDISGKSAMDATIQQGSNLINISNLKSGMYIIKYQSGIKVYSGKLMKIN